MRRHPRQIVRVSIRLLCGDALEQLRLLEVNSVDAVVTDPPYGIGFMGKTWDNFGGPLGVGHGLQRAGGREAGGAMKAGDSYDRSLSGQHGFQSWCEVWAVEALRVAKPGAHLLAFGGTRTFHRLTCAIEDAGWEIRDCLGWIYGSGFPKSLNAAVAVARSVDPTWEIGSPYPEAAIRWQGWGTGLKPAWEPIILTRKPLEGTVAENVQKWGTGALNIDGCRITAQPGDYSHPGNDGISPEGRHKYNGGWAHANQMPPSPAGRWPANLIHDGSEEVVGMFPQVNNQTGDRFKGGGFVGANMPIGYADSGSAARFFYCAKASKEDRDEGLEYQPKKFLATMGDGIGAREHSPKEPSAWVHNNHPTVKPTALMRYLCRLVTPPGGTVLDPFMGSGSTGKAAVLEGFSFIGIDNVPEYVEIARRRIEGTAPLFLQSQMDIGR